MGVVVICDGSHETCQSRNGSEKPKWSLLLSCICHALESILILQSQKFDVSPHRN